MAIHPYTCLIQLAQTSGITFQKNLLWSGEENLFTDSTTCSKIREKIRSYNDVYGIIHQHVVMELLQD